MENELVVSEQSGTNDPFTLAEVSVNPEVTPETTGSLGDNDIVPTNNEPFNHATFEKIDFSPEYFKDLMKSFGGKKEIISQSGERYTPTRAFAAQAAGEFDARTGMGNYDELKNGTSKFMPGKRFSDIKVSYHNGTEGLLRFFRHTDDRKRSCVYGICCGLCWG